MGEAIAWSRENSEPRAPPSSTIAGVDGARKGGLVGIELAEDPRQECVLGRGGRIGRGFGVAIEFEELGEEREDEGEGYLEEPMSADGMRANGATDTILTKSRRREMKTTLSTLLRVAASTGPAMVVLEAV
jgi:hypothetical protein